MPVGKENHRIAAMSLERQVRALVLLGAGLSFLHPLWPRLAAFIGGRLMFSGITDTCGTGERLLETTESAVDHFRAIALV